VHVPSVGLEIGQMEYWLLTRRGDTPSGSEEWDLHAAFSYINKFAFMSRSDRRIVLTLGDMKKDGKQIRLEETGGRTDLDGTSLLIERVKVLW
jgi:hypothetical protein